MSSTPYQPDTAIHILTHCGLVMPYGDIDLYHQDITWTNVDYSSVRSSDIHLRSISLETSQPSITEVSLKIIYLKFC